MCSLWPTIGRFSAYACTNETKQVIKVKSPGVKIILVKQYEHTCTYEILYRQPRRARLSWMEGLRISQEEPRILKQIGLNWDKLSSVDLIVHKMHSSPFAHSWNCAVQCHSVCVVSDSAMHVACYSAVRLMWSCDESLSLVPSIWC